MLPVGVVSIRNDTPEQVFVQRQQSCSWHASTYLIKRLGSLSSVVYAGHPECLSTMLQQSEGRLAAAYDPMRTLRMFGFGFCWYGPYQYYWYSLLDHMMPLKNTVNFLSKVGYAGCTDSVSRSTRICSTAGVCHMCLQLQSCRQYKALSGN